MSVLLNNEIAISYRPLLLVAKYQSYFSNDETEFCILDFSYHFFSNLNF